MAMKRIGVLWKGREGKKAVLSGEIDLLGQAIKIGIFLNTDENKKPNHPDYHILRYSDDPRGDEQGNDREPPAQREENLPF